MKNAIPVTMLPTLTRPAQAPARPANSPARGRARRILRWSMALVLAVVLAQVAVRSIRSASARAHAERPPPAAGLAANALGASPGGASRGFRDDAPCELAGEPVECR